jgi:DNA polymerase-1
MKLFLIDTYSIIYRAYYAFIKSPRINSKGQNTSAIYGFVNCLEDVIKTEKPTHIGAGFDPVGPTFRHLAYDKYKAHREESPEAIRKSIPIIKEILKAYNIPILEVDGFEADDTICTIAKKAEMEGIKTYMLTPDKDYGQIVSDNIFIYRPKFGGGYETMGVKEVINKFSIKNVEQIKDMLGLMGDASDNIPGCPGIGEKTATKLLEEYHSIENLLNNIHNIKGSLQKRIIDNEEQIRFSKFLATINTEVPIAFEKELFLLSQPDEQKLIEIYEELEFRSFVKKISTEIKKQDISIVSQGSLFTEFEANSTTTSEYSNLKGVDSTEHKYYIADNKGNIEQLAELISNSKIITFDTETDSINPLSANLVGISFSINEFQAWYIPIPEDFKKAKDILVYFSPTLQNKDIIKVGQNIKFDILALRKYGIEVAGTLFDTMIAHYVINPELRHGMDYLAEVYLKYKTIHIDELIGEKGKHQISMRDVPLERIAEYAAEDSDVTLRLKNIFEKEIRKQNLEYLFYEIESPLIYVLADMEEAGVKLDIESINQSSISLMEDIKKIERDIYNYAGTIFNINSQKQVGEIIFDVLKLDKNAKKTKSGTFSTNEETLEKLRNKHPIIEALLEYRGLKKLLSTYIISLPKMINPHTGKIHTSYNQTVTSTGRLSSSNPNLQNIPIKDQIGREIRRAFIPDNDNCVFLSADYSQIELRIMAHLSKDENMIDAFNKKEDIHIATASKIYNIPISEVSQEMRRKAKTANFGIIYGISTFGLAERLSIPRSEAKTLIEGYFNTYPQIQKYMHDTILRAKENGYVETIFKRKRFLPDINSNNTNVRGYAERNAINAPIQGSAADIIKIAMINIHKQFKENNLKSKMIMQVHDELNFNVLKTEIEQVKDIVIREMENVVKLDVPLIADYGIGANWLEAH